MIKGKYLEKFKKELTKRLHIYEQIAETGEGKMPKCTLCDIVKEYILANNKWICPCCYCPIMPTWVECDTEIRHTAIYNYLNKKERKEAAKLHIKDLIKRLRKNGFEYK